MAYHDSYHYKTPENVRKAALDYYHRNKEKILARHHTRREADWRWHLFQSKKWQAKKKGLDFTLVYEDLVWPLKCPVFGIDLDYKRKVGVKPGQDDTPTFDRIDNTKGYSPDNTVIISRRANRMKSDATKEELKQLAEFYNK